MKNKFGHNPNHFEALIQSHGYQTLKQLARGSPAYVHLEEAIDDVFHAGKYPQQDYRAAVDKISDRMLYLQKNQQARTTSQGYNPWYQDQEEDCDDEGNNPMGYDDDQNIGDDEYQTTGNDDHHSHHDDHHHS